MLCERRKSFEAFSCAAFVVIQWNYLLQDLQRVDHDLLAREFRADGSLNIVLRMTIAIKLSNKLHLDVCRTDVGRTNVTGSGRYIYVLQQSCTVLIIMISTCFVNTRVFIKDLIDLYRLARDGEAVKDIVFTSCNHRNIEIFLLYFNACNKLTKLC